MIKNQKGFTLLEMVVSIAILSFVSVFILQMFLSASTLNNRAKSVDAAMAQAITEIENLKSYSSLSEYLADENIDDASDIYFCFDKDWNRIAETADTSFYLKLGITPETISKDGSLYIVEVDVTDTSGRTLTTLSTKKYFPMNTEGI